jgi:plastocyanin
MRARHSVMAAFLPVAVAVSWLAFNGAGSFAETKPTPGDCKANGTALSITARDNQFDKDCLAVPANQASTIAFDNEDRGIPHNVSIYKDDSANEALFKGDVIEGPKRITYNVPALPEGRYFFRCDPHPEFMYGTFLSGNPPAAATTTTTAPPPTTTTTASPSPLPLPKILPHQGVAR